MFYVYLLKSKKDKKFYIGLTSNLKRRFKEHNNGYTRSTKGRRPFDIIYYEAYLNFEDAKTRESRLKKFKNSYTELKKRIPRSLKEV
ncbi:GIY-YIG nuclease family protein [Candidatus Parcubacteria bacterium]|nr:GIY-YIG nuclease family protein [Candidatus Parcubacteria bacterium]